MTCPTCNDTGYSKRGFCHCCELGKQKAEEFIKLKKEEYGNS